jgi:hypothetical protein
MWTTSFISIFVICFLPSAAPLVSDSSAKAVQIEIDVETLVESLVEYERKYFGQVVEPGHWKLFPGNTNDFRLWFSANGEVTVYEYEISTEIPAGYGRGPVTKAQRTGVFSTRELTFKATQQTENGQPGHVSFSAVFEPFRQGLATSADSVLFGYSQLDAIPFSEICGMKNAKLSVREFRIKDERLVGLACHADGFGDYLFGFERIEDAYRLRYFHVIKRTGDLRQLLEGKFKLGSGDSAPNEVRKQLEQEYLEARWFPIEYDDKGFPVRVGVYDWQEAPGAPMDHVWATLEIKSHEPSRRVLRADRLEFDNLTLPKEGEVTVYRSGVPTKFENGRLVSLVDGRAIDEINRAGKVRIRGARNWIGSSGFYLLLFGVALLLGVGGWKWWVYRTAT